MGKDPRSRNHYEDFDVCSYPGEELEVGDFRSLNGEFQVFVDVVVFVDIWRMILKKGDFAAEA